MTTLEVQRLDGDWLVIEAARIARAFFSQPAVKKFEEVAGTTQANAITGSDIQLLNSKMGARTPHRLWQEIVTKPGAWLQQIDLGLDLIATSDQRWKEIDGDHLVHAALIACVGPGRSIGVATKLLHLKRPRLFPILDSLVVELLGTRVPTGTPEARARTAADLVLYLRKEGRENRQPLKVIRNRLRDSGTDVSAVRILDGVLWSCHPAAGGIAARGRVFRCARPRV